MILRLPYQKGEKIFGVASLDEPGTLFCLKDWAGVGQEVLVISTNSRADGLVDRLLQKGDCLVEVQLLERWYDREFSCSESSSRDGDACAPIQLAHLFVRSGGALSASLWADSGGAYSRMVDTRAILPRISGVAHLFHPPASKS